MSPKHLSLFAAALLLWTAPGCQDAGKSDVLPPVIVHTPLALDPTDDWKVARWWTNGEQLLRLEPDASYALYPTRNRYHQPLERGRWSKESYAVILLDPYDEHRQELVRVGASRIDGRIALTIPDREPMFALDGPPRVAEDELLGEWRAERAGLRLSGDRRYTFTAAPSSIDAPAKILGHGGRWRVTDGWLVLLPDAPNMGPYQLRVEGGAGEADGRDEEGDEASALILGESRFTRVSDGRTGNTA